MEQAPKCVYERGWHGSFDLATADDHSLKSADAQSAEHRLS